MIAKMWNSFKAHFSKSEVLSLVDSFVTGFALDSFVELQRVLEGDLSRPALLGLIFAVARSVWKVLRKVVHAAAIKPKENAPSQV